jgi:ATP-dependent DNA ligase
MSTVRESYDARRTYLVEIFKTLDDLTFVKLAESFTPSVKAVEAIWKRGGEGAILKRRLAYYQPGARSRDFIKVKAVATVPMTVLGYEKGKQGPYSTVRVQDADGIETTVKTLDMDALNAFEADPESFIGRTLRIEYQERTPDGLYRHPRWDRWENE